MNLPNSFTFEFSCYIEGEQYYVLKNKKTYSKFQVITYFYYPNKDRFCILVKEDDDYVIFLKEEILNITEITYLNENLLADLSAVCNYYRAEGNSL